MSVVPGIGILGIGAYLPPEVRRNDWWPADVVARWMEQRARQLAALRAAPPPASRGAARIRAAMVELGADPFQGSVERRIMASDATSYDLEEQAARDALARAELAPADIDLVLCYTLLPEYLINNSACVLHQRLGLGRGCFTMQTDATAFSFLAQLTLAHQLIAGGRARRALLVQSCGVTRLLDPADPRSPLFGDGATAIVVGAVSDGLGFEAEVHRTDSRHPFWLAASPVRGRWYDEGRAVLHCPDPVDGSQVFLDIADQAEDAVSAVLAAAGRRTDEIDFFASHQGMPWIRTIAQDHVGLGSARSLDTFPATGSLFAANVPLVLRRAEDERLLGAGDRVLLFGGGTGVTYGATVVRWGR
jgi:3-oxoacyl-[acyl-carrier-protein] synthase III